jgi:hypothetical protein
MGDECGGLARRMWTLFEPVHAVCYFAPEGRAAFEAAGLRGFWRGYFAGRAAPLGTVGAEVVTASFYNFAPAMVARAIPSVWELITPEDALRVREAGAVAALHGLLDGLDEEVAQAADLLWAVAAGQLDCAGRVLGAANAALPMPQDPMTRLWQAATTLREHRGDGHFAALLAADVDGCEALVLRCGLDMRREDLQPVRRWTDEGWEAAQTRLAGRGYLSLAGKTPDGNGSDGALTEAGRQAHRAIEQATDRAAARPWAALEPGGVAELERVLTPIAQAAGKVLPHPSPIGLPAPGTS